MTGASSSARPNASVALATYNGAAFLRAQLDSILAQTEPPDEIVITDDQSSDATLDLLAEYAARSPIPIHVHRNDQRLGFTRNFARAISLCRSELIFLCDQDDLWLPRKVELMKAAFADPTVFLAYHDALVVTGDNEPLYQFYHADRERALLATAPIDPWYSSYGLTQAFRSSLRRFDDLWPTSLNHVWIENEPLSHDQWYFFLAQVFGRVAYVDETLVRYRQHGANSVGADPSGRSSTAWDRVRLQLIHDARLDRLRSAAAERRAAILDAVGDRTDGDVATRAGLLADRYRLLAARLLRRHRTYTAPSLPKRAAGLAAMIGRADYRDHPWGFRPASVLRDLAGGVLGNQPGSVPPVSI